MFDGETFGAEIVASVKVHVANSIAPLLAEIVALKTKVAELEMREPLRGEKGDKGDPGESIMGPPGKDGESIMGPPGPVGPPGDIGPQGPEGVGLASSFIDQAGYLVQTFTDGTVGKVGMVQGPPGRDGRDGADGIGKDGKDGKNGIDGLGFDDVHEEMDADGRTLIRRLTNGERVKEFRHKIHFLQWLGVFKSGEKYDFQDAVTCAGGIWVCQRETMEQPGYACKDWTLAVKEGRRGRDGKDGEKGDPGLPGRNGRDLTQMDFAGNKF